MLEYKVSKILINDGFYCVIYFRYNYIIYKTKWKVKYRSIGSYFQFNNQVKVNGILKFKTESDADTWVKSNIGNIKKVR